MTRRSQLKATEGKPENIAPPLLRTPGRSVYRHGQTVRVPSRTGAIFCHGQKMAIHLVKDATRRRIYSMIRSKATLPYKNATKHSWPGRYLVWARTEQDTFNMALSSLAIPRNEDGTCRWIDHGS